MEKDRRAVLRLANELHEIRDEIAEELDLLVDEELVEEMKRMGIFDS